MVSSGQWISELIHQQQQKILPIVMIGTSRWMNLLVQTIRHLSSIHLVGLSLAILLATLVLYVIVARYQTYRRLTKCGFPTIYWSPQLWKQRKQSDDDELISSSTITNILPRMQRLQGRHYGMYGTVYGVTTAVVHVAHPVPAAAILSQTTQRKRPAYNHFFDFCGQGVFTADGDDWRRQRKAVVQAVVQKRHTVPAAAAAAAADQCVRWLRRAPQGADGTFNIVPILQRVTIGMMYEFLTGNALLDADFPPNIRKATTSSTTDPSSFLSTYLQAITDIRMLLLAQSRSIWYLLPRWLYRWCSTVWYPAQARAMGPIRRLAVQACTTCQPTSPLGVLQQLEHVYPKQQQQSIAPRILDETITLLFAGQDTSAATLSWTLYLLSQHTHVQERLARELLLQDDNKYLEAVIKESMRLYPVAPFVVRQIGDTPLVIPDGTTKTTIPAHTLACIWIYSLHRNPAVWKERPNDFWPERWLTQNSTPTHTTQAAFLPFAMGPRQCLGQPVAQTVLRHLLARIVREFVIVASSQQQQQQMDMQTGFTVLPRGGVHVRLTPRSVASSS